MLFSHQSDGAAWLHAKLQAAPPSRKAALLGDTPGLGKTRTLLETARRLGAVRPLVLAPASAVTHFVREANEMGMFPPQAMSYDMAVRHPDSIRGFDLLIADESHYLKVVTSKRSQLVLGKGGVLDAAQWALFASGTPVPRHPGELAPMLFYAFPDALRVRGITTPQIFRERFLIEVPKWTPHGMRMKVVGMKDAEGFRELLDAIMLRRTVADIGMDVPSVLWGVQTLNSSHLMRKRQDGENDIRNALLRGVPLEELLHDEHVARYRRNIGLAKVPAVIEKLRGELEESDEQVVVFAQHTDVLHALRDGLKDYGVSFVDGSVAAGPKRDAQEAEFQHGKTRVFVGQNQACHVSLTLTAAQRAVLVEPDWAAYVNYQLGQRIARLGSKFKHTFGQMIALAGTLDEAIVRQNARETKMAQEMFET